MIYHQYLGGMGKSIDEIRREGGREKDENSLKKS
jgi:hypothetical protein